MLLYWKIKYTGVLPPLIGFFYNLFSIIILGGLISSGFYYIYGTNDTSKNGFKRTFIRVGKNYLINLDITYVSFCVRKQS